MQLKETSFMKKDVAHEHTFENPTVIAGVKFPNLALFGKNIVIEFTSKGDRKVIPACLALPIEQNDVTYYLPSTTTANHIKIWYSGVSPKALQQLGEAPPSLLCVGGRGREASGGRRRGMTTASVMIATGSHGSIARRPAFKDVHKSKLPT
jgi:hypothetical protein